MDALVGPWSFMFHLVQPDKRKGYVLVAEACLGLSHIKSLIYAACVMKRSYERLVCSYLHFTLSVFRRLVHF